jgi:branched-chain amino acid transport system ATP-binding protein
VTLLGPNGAGKTTTLLTLTGRLKPLGGTIRWRHVEPQPRHLSPHVLARSGVGLVAERGVFHSLTTEANLALGRGDAKRALGLFPELKPLLKRRAGMLSGGEQQMLALARALAASPRVLLLDEVSAGLAPMVVSRLFDAIRAAAHEQGVGILLVEQQIRRALSVADRGYVVNRGAVVLEGSADHLARQFEAGEAAYFA